MLKPTSTRVPFACDSRDNAFESVVGGGTISIARQSKAGEVVTSTDALISVSIHGINGDVKTYADPGVVGLLPDQAGGVWLVSEEGNGAATDGVAYPSLAHETFAT